MLVWGLIVLNICNCEGLFITQTTKMKRMERILNLMMKRLGMIILLCCFALIGKAQSPDSMWFTIPPGGFDTLCPTADDLSNVDSVWWGNGSIGDPIAFIDFISFPPNIVTGPNGHGCYVFKAGFQAGLNEDTILIIAFDSLGVADSTLFILSVANYPSDTQYASVRTGDTMLLCATGDDIGNLDSVLWISCIGAPLNGTILGQAAPPNDNCIIYEGGLPTIGYPDTICIVGWSGGSPDTTVWIIQTPATNDTIYVTVPILDTILICATGDDILAVDSVSYLSTGGSPLNGIIFGNAASPADSCIIYVGNQPSIGFEDTIRLVGYSGGISDTTVWIIQIPHRPDTMYVTITDRDTLCATADELIQISYQYYSECHGPLNYGAIIDSVSFGGVNPYCFVYQASDSSVYGDTLCIVAVDSFGNADTSVWIISTGCNATATNLGPDLSVCAGSSIPIGAALPVNSGNTYQWTATPLFGITQLVDPGGGNMPDTLANPVYVAPNVPGLTYCYDVTVTNGTCVSTDQICVTVTSGQLPIANAGQDVTICAGSAGQIGSPSIAGNTYTWSSTPACMSYLFSQGLSTPTIFPPNSAVIVCNYVLQVDSANMCSSYDTVNVIIANPVADAGPDVSACVVGSTIIGGDYNFPHNFLFDWTGSPLCLANLSCTNCPNPVYTGPPFPGFSCTYILEVRDSLGTCSSFDTVVVTTVSGASPIANAGPDTTVCQGSSLQLGIPPTAPHYSYQWQAIGGTAPAHLALLTNDTLSNPLVFIPSSGYANDTLSYVLIADNDTCTANDTVSIIVLAPNAFFSYTQISFCTTDPIISPDSISNPGGSFSSSPAGLFLNPTTGSIAPTLSSPGTYNILYSIGGTCPDSFSLSITIDPQVSAAFTLVNDTICAGSGSVVPISTVTNNGGVWTANGGLVINPLTGTIMNNVPGQYDICYTTSFSTCPDTVCKPIWILPIDSAEFVYPIDTICEGVAGPAPSRTGGVFSIMPLVGSGAGIATVDPVTGVVSPFADPGCYAITHTTSGNGIGWCAQTYTDTLCIDSVRSANFSYVGDTFCIDGSTISPTGINVPGGSFTASNGLSINSTTGAIDLVAGTPSGTIQITYYSNQFACPDIHIHNLTLINIDTAAFSYPADSICQGITNAVPSRTGGVFTIAPIGGSHVGMINATTGIIGGLSDPGQYQVTHLTTGFIPGWCSDLAVDTITIVAGASAVRDSVVVTINQSVLVKALWNDVFTSFDSVLIATNGLNGSAIYNGLDTTFTYTANTNFVGVDSFEYALWINGCSNYAWAILIVDTTTNCAAHCVWPGDADNDGVVNNFDILEIGLNYGSTVVPRFDQTIGWYEHSAQPWPSLGNNLAHSDCDGNGAINHADTTAVSVNYGLIHSKGASASGGPFDPVLRVENPDSTLIPDSLYNFPINFGDMTIQANNSYGLAFTINYDPALVDTNSVNIDFSGSWLGNINDLVVLYKDFHASGKVEIGISRTDQMDVSGFGQIGSFSFITEENLVGKMFTDTFNFDISISNVRYIDAAGTLKPINAVDDNNYLLPVVNLQSRLKFNIYPNPADNLLTVQILDETSNNNFVELIDMNGVVVHQASSNNAALDIELNNYAKGVYFVRVVNDNGAAIKKLIIAE